MQDCENCVAMKQSGASVRVKIPFDSNIELYGYNEREVELYKRKIQKQRTEKEKTWQIRKEKSLIL